MQFFAIPLNYAIDGHGSRSEKEPAESTDSLGLNRTGFKSRACHLLVCDRVKTFNLFEFQFPHLQNGNNNYLPVIEPIEMFCPLSFEFWRNTFKAPILKEQISSSIIENTFLTSQVSRPTLTET